jgi:hypothetical protein
VKKGVLTVRDNEHNVADTVEATKSHVGSCRVWEMRGKIPVAQIQLAGPTFFPGMVAPQIQFILIYNQYIYILLIKTNPMTYCIYVVQNIGGMG